MTFTNYFFQANQREHFVHFVRSVFDLIGSGEPLNAETETETNNIIADAKRRENVTRLRAGRTARALPPAGCEKQVVVETGAFRRLHGKIGARR